MKAFIWILAMCATIYALTWSNWSYQSQSPMLFYYIDSNNQKWGSNDSVIAMFDNSPYVKQKFYIHKNAQKPLGKLTIPNYINDSLFVYTVYDTPHAVITFNPKTTEFTYDYYPDTMPTIQMFMDATVAPDSSIWINVGTQGMVHFDHGKWTLYDSTNSTLKKSWGGKAYFDNQGRVWIAWQSTYATPCGISIFDGENWSLLDSTGYNIPVSLNVDDVEFGPDGTVWFAIYTDYPVDNSNGGIVRFRNDSMTYYDPRAVWGDPYPGVTQINRDKNGVLWFDGTGYTKDNGTTFCNYVRDSLGIVDLNKFVADFSISPINHAYWWLQYQGPAYYKDTGKIVKYDTIAFGKQMKDMKYLTTGPDSTAWFYLASSADPLELVSFKNGIYRRYCPYTLGLSNDTTTAISVSNANTRYIATNYGVSRYEDTSWNAWPTGQVGISPITSLYSDNSDNLWAGSSSGSSSEGLAKFDGSSWSLITIANSNLPSPEIYDICEGSGKLWISHREGISSYDGTTFTNYTRGKEFPVSVSMGGITFDKSGNLWTATSNGAFKFDGTTWTTFDSSNSSMPVNYLFDVAIDTAGDLWFGSLKTGLVKFDGSSWSTIDSANGAPSNDIRKVVTDSFGKLWIPSDKGVYRFDGSSWSVYDSANSDLQDNRISSIAIGADGSKWFGTKYNGIAQLIDDDIVGTVVKPAFKTVSPKLTVVGNEIRFSGTGATSLKLFDLRGRVVFNQNWADLNGSASVVPTVGKGVYVARLNMNGLVVGMKIKL